MFYSNSTTQIEFQRKKEIFENLLHKKREAPLRIGVDKNHVLIQNFHNYSLKYSGASIQQTPSLVDIVAMSNKQKRQQRAKELENQFHSSSQQLSQLTESMKSNFDEIRTEQAIILHDNLELHERFLKFHKLFYFYF